MHGLNSPALEAARIYVSMFGDGDNDQYLSFGQMMDAYLVNGYVVATPEYFICARPVIRSADEDDIINPIYPFNLSECNAWFVGLMAGDPSLIWTYYPLALQYCGYQRNGTSMRWMETDKIRRKIMGSKPKAVKDPPKTPPPPTLDNKDADAASRQARRSRANRRGYKSTLLSSQGGDSSAASASQAGTKNLLG